MFDIRPGWLKTASMARKTIITTETTLHLSYPAAEYPGWGQGQKITVPVIGPDGTAYCFAGLAVVILKHRNRSRVDVDIVHNPSIDPEASDQ